MKTHTRIKAGNFRDTCTNIVETPMPDGSLKVTATCQKKSGWDGWYRDTEVVIPRQFVDLKLSLVNCNGYLQLGNYCY